jgi:DNA-binding MarR family transcriptional regulator
MSKSADDLLKLDRQICFPIYAASNLLTRLYRPLLDEIGLTYPQYLVMLVLWETPSRTVGELGAALHLDSGTLTPLLKRLEANGLVDRMRDPDDERRVIVTLTPDGKALKKKAASVPEALMERSGLDLAGMERLRASVQAMVSALADVEGA